jgi:hypothetical protein
MFATLQVNKLLELHKESCEEWSRKAGELEGVVKALEVKCSVSLVFSNIWSSGVFVFFFFS